MEEPRFLADAMLGRLTRYLRMLGYDTLYRRDASENELRRAALAEGRVVLTRDRALAAVTPEAVLLHEGDLAGQLRELARLRPPLRDEPRFDRCTLCNGLLRPEAGSNSAPGPMGSSQTRRAVHRCGDCGQRYWEGSHTARIREEIRRAIRESST
ncbi:MAG: Mut7-C RNAse domain-containing protein [Thermoplasmata archaeon]